jgi:hypothetical protein
MLFFSVSCPLAYAKSRVIKWREIGVRSRHDTVILVSEAKVSCTSVTGVRNEQMLRIYQKKMKVTVRRVHLRASTVVIGQIYT